MQKPAPTKIGSLIDLYCSAEQVSAGKPQPDLFLFAADKLGINPNECLVLEDAPTGIAAANAAGMKSYAIPSRETKNKDFSQATRKLKSLNEVFDYLTSSKK